MRLNLGPIEAYNGKYKRVEDARIVYVIVGSHPERGVKDPYCYCNFIEDADIQLQNFSQTFPHINFELWRVTENYELKIDIMPKSP